MYAERVFKAKRTSLRTGYVKGCRRFSAASHFFGCGDCNIAAFSLQKDINMIKSAFFNIDHGDIILFFLRKASYTDNQEEQIQGNNLQNKKDRRYTFEKEKE